MAANPVIRAQDQPPGVPLPLRPSRVQPPYTLYTSRGVDDARSAGQQLVRHALDIDDDQRIVLSAMSFHGRDRVARHRVDRGRVVGQFADATAHRRTDRSAPSIVVRTYPIWRAGDRWQIRPAQCNSSSPCVVVLSSTAPPLRPLPLLLLLLLLLLAQ